MLRPRDRRRRDVATVDAPAIDGFAMAKEANIAKANNHDVANTELPGRRVTASATRNSLRGTLSAEASAHLSSLLSSDLKDEVPVHFDDGEHVEGVTPRRPENLPTIISTAVARTDDNWIVPEWHQVRNLPGYRAEQIRALGRQIFRMFTETPLEDIQTCTTLSNDVQEVQAMMAWIKKNGIRNDKMEMDFNQVMPAYKADVQSWDVEGFSFLLVRDPSGHYIYGWPGGRGVHLEEEPPRPMLR